MSRYRAALAGVVAGAVTLGVAELTAGVIGRAVSPALAVGGAAVDRTPRFLKEFAIRTFGEHDKQVLIAGVLVTVALLAAVLGVVADRRRRLGLGGVAVLGVIAAAAAASRPDARPVDVLPSLVGAAVGALALHALLGPTSTRPQAAASSATVPDLPGEAVPGPSHAAGRESGRREILLLGAGVGVAAVSALSGRALLARRTDVAASRAAVVLPTPKTPMPSQAGTTVGVPGVSSLFTPNRFFYRVDTALTVPRLTAEDWRLRIHGLVRRELELTFDDLLRRPTVENDVTLTCVSNEVGGPLMGNARWVGVALAPLLEEAGVLPEATQLVSRSVDGMTIGTPTAAVLDGRPAMLAIGMNGEPLPPEHGFPVRMVVPGLYGYVSATKWLVDLELSTFEAFDAYWVRRGWARLAPIRTSSRIDTPEAGAVLRAGRIPVAGVAWAQRRGISAVEVRVDDGPWQPARLAEALNTDVWRQWVYVWDARPGSHTLQVRARDGAGEWQDGRRRTPFPSGSTGWQTRLVTVDP